MGNNTNYEQTMTINKIKTKIICPKCPLIPIINITTTKEGTLICEYRCPSFHMGLIKLEEMIKTPNEKNKSKSKELAIKCLSCKGDLSKMNKNILKYCGICGNYICDHCIEGHNKVKSKHKVINYNKINSVCLIHGINIKFYCFTCLRNICTKCVGHKNHCFKELKEIEPNKELIENMEYYFQEVFNYFSSIEKNIEENDKEKFIEFKDRNLLLLYFVKDLYQIYLNKKEKKTLNGEIIINLLNLSQFNLDSKNIYTYKDFYLKNHLITNNTSVSSICSFTNTKANYKIGELTPIFFKYLNFEENYPQFKVLRMDYNFIAYNIEKMLYFMKNEEKVYFFVKLNEIITDYYQLKDHTVAICSKDKIYFYKLMQIEPYIVEIKVYFPKIDNIYQLYGSIYDNLYVLTENLSVYKLIHEKINENNNKFDIFMSIKFSKKIIPKGKNSFLCNKDSFDNSYSGSNSYIKDKRIYNNLEDDDDEYNDNSINEIDNNKSSNIENIYYKNIKKEIRDNDNSYIEESENEKADNKNINNNPQMIINKLIMYEKNKKPKGKENSKINAKNMNFSIKGIVYNYLILNQNEGILIINTDKLTFQNELNDYHHNFINFIIYNNHILIANNNVINFLTVPDFLKVSEVHASEPIIDYIIPNKNMILLIGKHSIEQLELNTWKRVSKLMDRELFNFEENKKDIIVGNNNELYLFKNEDIYKFEKRT